MTETKTLTITEFVNARLLDLEHVCRGAALVAGGSRWNPPGKTTDKHMARTVWADSGVMMKRAVVEVDSMSDDPAHAVAEYIAGLDPRMVYGFIDLMRLIVERYPEPEPRPTDDLWLHAHSLHPEYEYTTVETGRKTDADDTPPDDGKGPWEPNNYIPVHDISKPLGEDEHGRPTFAVLRYTNWDRFDYTEETYWRRRLPEPRVVEPQRAPIELRTLASLWETHPDFNMEWWRV